MAHGHFEFLLGGGGQTGEGSKLLDPCVHSSVARSFRFQIVEARSTEWERETGQGRGTHLVACVRDWAVREKQTYDSQACLAAENGREWDHDAILRLSTELQKSVRVFSFQQQPSTSAELGRGTAGEHILLPAL